MSGRALLIFLAAVVVSALPAGGAAFSAWIYTSSITSPATAVVAAATTGLAVFVPLTIRIADFLHRHIG
ncbi:hypothetical protein GCM10010428_63530 [Actinosynnema pretiosum subsp. pretiosum]